MIIPEREYRGQGKAPGGDRKRKPRGTFVTVMEPPGEKPMRIKVEVSWDDKFNTSKLL
jgi:hypothetical protein